MEIVLSAYVDNIPFSSFDAPEKKFGPRFSCLERLFFTVVGALAGLGLTVVIAAIVMMVFPAEAASYLEALGCRVY